VSDARELPDPRAHRAGGRQDLPSRFGAQDPRVVHTAGARELAQQLGAAKIGWLLGKSGDARKSYMSSCLKGEDGKKEPSAAQKKQQERMKDCNAKAEGKSGDERKKFMSTCLKG
jgi:hypothetical protein